MDVALGTNYAQDFNIDLHSIDLDDVALPTTELTDAKHYASLLSSFLVRTLYKIVLTFLQRDSDRSKWF